MSDQTNPQSSNPRDAGLQDPQPESGFIDRDDEMSIRQSSPTNPRVSDKSEVNQEEA